MSLGRRDRSPAKQQYLVYSKELKSIRARIEEEEYEKDEKGNAPKSLLLILGHSLINFLLILKLQLKC